MLFQEGHKALVRLAKRKDSSYISWNCIRVDHMLGIHFKCYLCSELFYHDDKLDEHGIFHLKESNLLPFI